MLVIASSVLEPDFYPRCREHCQLPCQGLYSPARGACSAVLPQAAEGVSTGQGCWVYSEASSPNLSCGTFHCCFVHVNELEAHLLAGLEQGALTTRTLDFAPAPSSTQAEVWDPGPVDMCSRTGGLLYCQGLLLLPFVQAAGGD